MKTIEKLKERLNVIQLIKPEKASETSFFEGTVSIDESTKKQDYCELLRDLAIELQKYFQYFETAIRDNKMSEDEAEKLCEFIKDLTLYFKETKFLRGRKSQAWVDMAYLLFGTIIYYRAQLRLIEKTIEIFFLYEALAELEEVLYNNCYYVLIGYKN